MHYEHEYAILQGYNRSLIGRYIGTASATVSSAIVFVLLFFVDIAKRFGVQQNLPPIFLSLVSAGAVYAVLYWVFNKHIWRLPLLSDFLKVPDLSGKWECIGQTINPDGSLGYKWTAEVTIIQSWDKIRVRLKTAQSGSNSIAASLFYDAADGYRLMYNYVNDPNIGEKELQTHRGFADLVFAPTLDRAEGEYFNGHGRFTFGTMTLTKERIHAKKHK